MARIRMRDGNDIWQGHYFDPDNFVYVHAWSAVKPEQGYDDTLYETANGQWLLVRRARISYLTGSLENEKEMVDENSKARELSPEEAVEWFSDQGIPLPLALGEERRDVGVDGSKRGDLKTKACVFRKETDTWTVSYETKDARGLTHLVGFGYIHSLIANAYPPLPVSALDLTGRPKSAPHTWQPTLDDKAKKQYGREIRDLDEEIEQAKRDLNVDKQTELEKEKGQLLEQFKSATSGRGRDRNLQGPSPEREAAELVRANLRTAYAKLEKHGLADLVKHFRESITRETNAFAYRPKNPPLWEL